MRSVFAADILHGCLGAEGRIARQNQDGARRIQAGKQADDRIILDGRLIRRSCQKNLRFARLGMNIQDGEISFARA